MVSRRNFIKRSGIAAAGLAIWPSLGCLTANQNVGIQLYTLRDLIPNDVKGIISKISKAGYTEVETFDYNPKTGFWGFTPAEFYKILKDNGLSATSNHFGADMLLQTGSLEDTKRFIEVANILSSKAVTIPWMDEAFRKSADDYKKHANGFNKAGELSKKAGLQLAYHNHDFEFKKHQNTTGFDILLKETDPDLVAFEMDIYWVVRAGYSPTSYFEQHPGRFPMWHVKDMDKLDGANNTEVGNGSIDFKAIFKKADLAGMKHLFVEQENNYIPDPVASIEQSNRYIKAQLI